ncbi:MAG: hypothetical protein HON94_12040 [Methylococcales bacterium]|jgi:hypothetical protein|nr:hypothetical protein [Methylococcales bacterium]
MMKKTLNSIIIGLFLLVSTGCQLNVKDDIEQVATNQTNNDQTQQIIKQNSIPKAEILTTQIQSFDWTPLDHEIASKLSEVDNDIHHLNKKDNNQQQLETLGQIKNYYLDLQKSSHQTQKMLSELKPINSSSIAYLHVENWLNQFIPNWSNQILKSESKTTRTLASIQLQQTSQQQKQRLVTLFNQGNYIQIIELLDKIKAKNTPQNQFFYHISKYETGDHKALEQLTQLAERLHKNHAIELQVKLAQWFSAKQKIDLSIKVYGQILAYINTLNTTKALADKELITLNNIKTPIEKHVFALVKSAEVNLNESKNLDIARQNCFDAVKIMTTYSLFQTEFFNQCEDMFEKIRDQEEEIISVLLQQATQQANQEKEFDQARQLLHDYLKSHPKTDYRKEIVQKIHDINDLQNIFSNDICTKKISDFKNQYDNQCLTELQQGHYEVALSCFVKITTLKEEPCFKNVSSIDKLKKSAQQKILEIQPEYVRSQLEKAANLFTNARKIKSLNNKKEGFIKAYYILKKLKADYPQSQATEKLNRYIKVVEKEISSQFPELLNLGTNE